MWQSYTGECVRVLDGHNDDVNSAFFSLDGSLILSSSKKSYSFRIWETASGDCLRLINGISFISATANFSSDASLVVTALWDRTIRI
mmetsp:Transcript_50831/g.42747  ORF Transcript_50831/g.42747 Transcript_50831/m.42747 type:complete len:87 (-) Transcript_50831:70-330(-)